MGKRGPKPTPTPILLARGSWRGKARKDEPQAPTTKPICPGWLPPIAKSCWKWLTAQLEAMGLLSTAEAKLLERYCLAYAGFRDAQKHIEKHGQMVTLHDVNGNLVSMTKNPMLQERSRLSAELLRLEQQLGLTPSARVGMKVPAPHTQTKRGEELGGASRFFRGA